MTKRERRYHSKKKKLLTIINMLAENIREAIDAEIIETLKKIAVASEYGFESDLIPFSNKTLNV
jgi:uncharacterized protein YihD (DUF1040 family)